MSDVLRFNNFDIGSLFYHGDPQLSILDAKPNLKDSSGRDGAIFAGMTYGTSTVSVELAATGTAAERRNKFSQLGRVLMVDEPQKLYLPDMPDRYYLAVPSGPLELSRGFDAEWARLEFTLTDPVAYGAIRSKDLNLSEDYTTVTVSGTAPTSMDVVARGAKDTTSGLWGVKATYVDTTIGILKEVVVDLKSTVSTFNVIITSSTRTSTVGGNVRLPELWSDWLTGNPGRYQVRLYDEGNTATSVTVKWQERWY